MHRTRTLSPSLPVLFFAAACLALIAFGATRLLMSSRADALPALSVAGDTAAAQPGALNTTKLFQQRANTVVTIDSTVGSDELHGAGVVVGTDGTIVTASHVVKDYIAGVEASAVFVRFYGHDQVQATVVAIDQWNDLAVLKVDPRQVTHFVAAPMANSDAVLVGAEVAAIGNPFGHEWSITPGHVSNVHQTVDSQINANWKVPDAIQFDASINPGNSGGPLFNARGQVVGIVQQIAGTTKTNSGVSFAISASIVQRTLQLAKTTRDIPYAFTGLRAVDLSPQLARQQHLATATGALVQAASGPAAVAGIQTGAPVMYGGVEVNVGDVVVAVSGQPVGSAADLQRATGLLQVGRAIPVTIVRGSRRETVQLTPSIAQAVTR
ncbi:MAG: trypsin domain protein [Thermoleophilia bacterium]|nr:trypsin domain protein [Thermoleophilia bacterium]